MNLESITDSIIAFLPQLGFGMLLFLIFYIAARSTAAIILKLGSTGKLGRENVYKLLARFAKVAIIIFGVLTSLGTIGVDIMPLVAGLGLGGLAIGLALKDAVTNLINGILILYYHPFVKGDWVKLGSTEGIVGEINLRYIQIINKELGKEYLVPNSQAFSKEVVKKLPTTE